MNINASRINTPMFAGFVTGQEALPSAYEAFEATYNAALRKYKDSPRVTALQALLDQKIAELKEALHNGH